ncbi:hypothetical protein PV396_05770 [Streptomyces sp. ME02-8801-2C]|uniref:hypothetical protein n=1 Tax=Streptomyces sp. ME02-8801-2C TaxID=3028680 RepID=UPI0029BB5CD2|nr:hypothetical protein [Streptomyces sp. ME02-8801-2C]MDX3451463.1 hypothetical protein [Streptomyces sp. ME02-8801-2C]
MMTAATVSARGLRAAALRSAVGMRGRIPSGTSTAGISHHGMNKVTTITASAEPEPGRRGSVTSTVDTDIALVAARGRRAAALRSLVGTPGRMPRDAGSAA